MRVLFNENKRKHYKSVRFFNLVKLYIKILGFRNNKGYSILKIIDDL